MSLNATNLYIQASPLPATFKGTPNDLFAEMIRRMRILSPSGTNFIFIGDTEPTSNVGPWLKNGTQWYVFDDATKRYKPVDISPSFTPAFSVGRTQPTVTNPPFWMQTTQDATNANPTGFGEMVRFFQWDGVRWLAPHPVPPNDGEVRIWTRTEAELWGYDGGDGTDPSISPPTDFTGAMWVVETAFQFRFPVGVGTNPASFDGNPNSTIAVRGTGGDERIALAADEGGPHKHPLVADDPTSPGPVALDATNQIAKFPNTTAATTELRGSTVAATIGLSGPSVGGKSHQNMPPYYGVFFIKRSVRRYYTP